MDKIFISLSAYRDPDLVNTVKSFYEHAVYPENLYFSIVSHEDLDNPLDLSFIPDNQINYNRIDYRLALGACNGRHIANSLLSEKYKYFLQTDSHSRAQSRWDELVISHYVRCKVKWGEDYLFTKYPHGFLIDWTDPSNPRDNLFLEDTFFKASPFWKEEESLYLLDWEPLEDIEFGDRSYGFAANCVFGSAKSMLKIPYDPNLFFLGEEISLGVRAYVAGVVLASLPCNFLWTNYDRVNGRRHFIWNDDENTWIDFDKAARKRLQALFDGEYLGEYGLNDLTRYQRLEKESGVQFKGLDYVKPLYKDK